MGKTEMGRIGEDGEEREGGWEREREREERD